MSALRQFRWRSTGKRPPCFASSSAVRNLAACIGPRTAEAAREAGLGPLVVAPDASVGALVEALRRHAAERGADQAAAL